MHFCKVNWKLLSLKLGLHHSTISEIEYESKGILDDCLLKSLEAWLNKRDKVPKKGGPTLNALFKALDSITCAQKEDLHKGIQ